MKVSLGGKFALNFLNFPKADKEKILAFIAHVELHGLTALQGRNKSSDNVPTDHPNWLKIVKYAQKYQLWHYHIGIPHYQTANNGEQVSEYVLHYRLENDGIKIVDLSPHPPLELPTEDYLQ